MLLSGALQTAGLHLDAGLAEVVHDGHEARQDAGVLAGLQVRPQIRAHLAQCLARRPSHLRMLVCQTLRMSPHWVTIMQQPSNRRLRMHCTQMV